MYVLLLSFRISVIPDEHVPLVDYEYEGLPDLSADSSERILESRRVGSENTGITLIQLPDNPLRDERKDLLHASRRGYALLEVEADDVISVEMFLKEGSPPISREEKTDEESQPRE